jgi:hypothetical protein
MFDKGVARCYNRNKLAIPLAKFLKVKEEKQNANVQFT